MFLTYIEIKIELTNIKLKGQKGQLSNILPLSFRYCNLIYQLLSSRKGHLQRHIKSVHECQTFPCPHCEHKATWKRLLRTHIISVHEGQRFQCPLCEYKATQKGHLKTHIKSVHQMFPCPFCKYKANHKVNLQKHVKSSHEKDKSQGLKMELYSDNDDVEMEEYFETNVKSEADSDIIEFDRMKEVKQKFQYGNAKELRRRWKNTLKEM